MPTGPPSIARRDARTLILKLLPVRSGRHRAATQARMNATAKTMNVTALLPPDKVRNHGISSGAMIAARTTASRGCTGGGAAQTRRIDFRSHRVQHAPSAKVGRGQQLCRSPAQRPRNRLGRRRTRPRRTRRGTRSGSSCGPRSPPAMPRGSSRAAVRWRWRACSRTTWSASRTRSASRDGIHVNAP